MGGTPCPAEGVRARRGTRAQAAAAHREKARRWLSRAVSSRVQGPSGGAYSYPGYMGSVAPMGVGWGKAEGCCQRSRRGEDTLTRGPTDDALLEGLWRAMRRRALGAGRARRPTRVYLDNAEVVTALTPLLEALNIQCVYRHDLLMADEVMVEMETQMGKYKPLPGLVSIPSVAPQMLGHLYHLAAQFYRASPWR